MKSPPQRKFWIINQCSNVNCSHSSFILMNNFLVLNKLNGNKQKYTKTNKLKRKYRNPLVGCIVLNPKLRRNGLISNSLDAGSLLWLEKNTEKVINFKTVKFFFVTFNLFLPIRKNNDLFSSDSCLFFRYRWQEFNPEIQSKIWFCLAL